MHCMPIHISLIWPASVISGVYNVWPLCGYLLNVTGVATEKKLHTHTRFLFFFSCAYDIIKISLRHFPFHIWGIFFQQCLKKAMSKIIKNIYNHHHQVHMIRWYMQYIPQIFDQLLMWNVARWIWIVCVPC